MSAAAAILLAAGAGQRMGGPKALLVVDGAPLVLRHAERLTEAGCQPIVVVARQALVGEIRVLLSELSGALIVAADTSSMAHSLATAIRSMPSRPDEAVVVTPVDTLPPRRSTLDALLAAASANDVLVATPSYRGRGGHPVVVRQRLLEAFRAGYAGTLRELIRSAEPKRRRVAVDDPAVGAALDTPADLAALRPGATPLFSSRNHQR